MATTKKRAAARNPGFTRSRARILLSVGEMVKTVRELQEMTQEELGEASGLPQATICSIERGRIILGAARAEKLARALRVHPAVLLWPDWDTARESAATG